MSWKIITTLFLLNSSLLAQDIIYPTISSVPFSRDVLETNLQQALAHPNLLLVQNDYWNFSADQVFTLNEMSINDTHFPEKKLLILPGVTAPYAPENLTSNKSSWKKRLNGLIIALDPGHFGGNYARLEERFIHFSTPKEIYFSEGDLTLALAYKLKSLLERYGAQVILTRDQNSPFPLGVSFEQWKKSSLKKSIIARYHSRYKRWPDSLELEKMLEEIQDNEVAQFSYYNREDLEARARFLKSIKPDLTLYLHFNGSEKSPYRDEFGHTIDKEENFNMGFIAGSFMPGELSSEEDRIDFMRWLSSPDILKASKNFCSALLNKLKRKTHTPLAKQEDASYLQKWSVEAQDETGAIIPGLFHRNLVLTRRAPGIHCYLESLIQDNFKEAKKLGKENREIMDLSTSARVFRIAKAYFEGIKGYLENNP